MSQAPLGNSDSLSPLFSPPCVHLYYPHTSPCTVYQFCKSVFPLDWSHLKTEPSLPTWSPLYIESIGLNICWMSKSVNMEEMVLAVLALSRSSRWILINWWDRRQELEMWGKEESKMFVISHVQKILASVSSLVPDTYCPSFSSTKWRVF